MGSAAATQAPSGHRRLDLRQRRRARDERQRLEHVGREAGGRLVDVPGAGPRPKRPATGRRRSPTGQTRSKMSGERPSARGRRANHATVSTATTRPSQPAATRPRPLLPVARHTRALTIWPPSSGRPGSRLKRPTRRLAKATMPSRVRAVSFVVRARMPQTDAGEDEVGERTHDGDERGRARRAAGRVVDGVPAPDVGHDPADRMTRASERRGRGPPRARAPRREAARRSRRPAGSRRTAPRSGRGGWARRRRR